MSQLINLCLFHKALGLSPVCDYPPNSLLILVKEDKHDNVFLFIKFEIINSGKREEYFTYMAKNSDFNYFHFVNGEIEAGNIEEYIRELKSYEIKDGFILYPQSKLF